MIIKNRLEKRSFYFRNHLYHFPDIIQLLQTITFDGVPGSFSSFKKEINFETCDKKYMEKFTIEQDLESFLLLQFSK